MLIGSASHELRTPMNAIQGVIDILCKKLKESEFQSELTVIKISMKKLELYIKGLVILQRMEGKVLKINEEFFKPSKLIEETIDYFQSTLSMKEINVDSLSIFDFNIYADKEKYQLISYHLISNAIKNTNQGSIKIETELSPDKTMLITRVIDTGIGMNDIQKKNIFELFSENQDFDPCCPNDMNIGLFLINGLTNFLGGIVSIDSSIEKGTTISFSIKIIVEVENYNEELNEFNSPKKVPMLICNEGNTMNSLSGKKLSMNARRGFLTSGELTSLEKVPHYFSGCNCPKILIVDDEPFNIYILKNYAKKIGVTVETAINGKDAINKLIKRNEMKCCGKYGIVFMDINMPVMNGIVAIKKIRNFIEADKILYTPIIAVTAIAQANESETIAEYAEYGFNELLQKPVNNEIFIATLKKYNIQSV